MTQKTAHYLSGKKMIVAGGGIAGLAFAASIRQQWDLSNPAPQILIFNRDADDDTTQREGYSMSLAGHDNTGGLVALQKLGLLNEVLAHTVSGLDESTSFKIWGPDWKDKISLSRKPMDGLPSASIRIARRDLRRVLRRAAEHDHLEMRWSTTCTSAWRLEDGRVGVRARQTHGKDEEEYACDLLVVADGASSTLRSQLRPEDKLEYAGAVLRGGLSRFEGTLPQPLGRDWGFALSGTGVSCFYSPVDAHSVVWAVGNMEEVQVARLNEGSLEEAQEVVDRARALGARFQEPFQSIVSKTDLKTVMCINAKDKLPFAHTALGEISAVFIGDSNHGLSPFAGYGANLALRDGWDLAQKLCQGRSLKEAVGAYDRVAVPRAAKIVKSSRAKLKAGHSTGWRLWMFMMILAVGRFLGVLSGRRRR